MTCYLRIVSRADGSSFDYDLALHDFIVFPTEKTPGKGYCRRCDTRHHRVYCPDCGLKLFPATAEKTSDHALKCPIHRVRGVCDCGESLRKVTEKTEARPDCPHKSGAPKDAPLDPDCYWCAAQKARAKKTPDVGPARVFADADNNGRDARVLMPSEKTSGGCMACGGRGYIDQPGNPCDCTSGKATARAVPRCDGPHDMQPTAEWGDNGPHHCTRCGIADYQVPVLNGDGPQS